MSMFKSFANATITSFDSVAAVVQSANQLLTNPGAAGIADVLATAAAEQSAAPPFSSANLTTNASSDSSAPYTAPVQSVNYQVDLRQYSQEALNAVLYTYSGKFYVEQKLNDAGTQVEVTLLLKDLALSLSASEQHQLRGEFYQNLLDQQVRLDLEQRFGHIRDLLVAEAFKPVN